MVCPSWLSFTLYNPIRKAFVDREAVLQQCGINRDSIVIEIGPGNGFFTEVLVERASFVYAVELQERMIRKLVTRTARYPQKIRIIQKDIAAYTPDPIADVAFCYYVFHEIANKELGSSNIVQAIKPNGTLALYEPTLEVSRHDIEKTIMLFERLGMTVEDRHDTFWTRFVRLRKKNATRSGRIAA